MDPNTLAVEFSLGAVSVAVASRIVARKVHQIPFGWDDYSIFLGAAFAIGNSLVYVFSKLASKAPSTRQWLIHLCVDEDGDSENDNAKDLKALYVSYQLYGITITTIKLSVLWFHERFSSTPQSPYWHYGVSVLVFTWLLVNNLTAAFQCIPLQGFWDLLMDESCIDTLTFFLVMQVLNTLLDALILIVLLSAVLRLERSKLKMFGLLVLLLVGILCIVILIKQISNYSQTYLLESSSAADWRIIELTVEIFCACLPIVPLDNIDKHEKEPSNFEDLEGYTEMQRMIANSTTELHGSPRAEAELCPDDMCWEMNDTQLFQMFDEIERQVNRASSAGVHELPTSASIRRELAADP